jgi:NTP pyrophosphatase (non-canonical NTP hydrolase)
MQLNEYQMQRGVFAIYQKNGEHNEKSEVERLTYSVLALCGESGELANKLKKSLRSNTPPDPEVLADELGDVLWYVAAVAQDLGLELETVAKMNLHKLQERAKKDEIVNRVSFVNANDL